MRTIRGLFFRVFSVFRSGRADADSRWEPTRTCKSCRTRYLLQPNEAKESQHEARLFRALDSWWLDIKLGVRMLVKYLGLALAGGPALRSPLRSPPGDSA